MAALDREFVREHHLHYEVEPEEVEAPGKHEVTGWRVRLFATHGEDKLEDPACPRCVELRRDLTAFAEALVPTEGEDRAEVVSGTAPRIYKSTEVPDADEVHVTLRVLCGSAEHRAANARDERCLRPIADRLAQLGVPRR
jgi:hypothetical protein